MSIRHQFISAVADSGDTTIVQPSNWNETHISDDPVNETLAGIIDSTDGSDGNGIFTLAAPPNPPSSLQLFKNGLLQLEGLHFNLLGATIVYVPGFYPTQGDWHKAAYRK